MKKNIRELTDEETYAMENGDTIIECDYSDNPIDFTDIDELYGILESIGYLEYLIDRYEKAKINLIKTENLIIGAIGKDSFEDMIDLIDLQKQWFKRDIRESWESYDLINGKLCK